MPEEMKITNNKPSERNHGIDLLRIISMVYVIILHTLGLGGILDSLQPGTTQYTVYEFLEIWCFCAVNIFVIISGYTGFRNEERKTDLTKLIILWLEVIFYGVCVSVIYKIIHPASVKPETIRNMFFPLTNDVYWFFSAYTGVFLLKPILDTAVRHIDKKQLLLVMSIIFTAFCCFSMAANPFRMTEGYSFSWFLILYLIGAALKKCDAADKFTFVQAVAGIILTAAVGWLWKMFGFEIKIMNIRIHPGSFYSYISPVTVLCAVFHVILFSKLSFPNWFSRIISFLAPGAFAVYLINTHPCLWLNEFNGRFADWGKLNTISGFFRITGYALSFVIAALLIDKIRQFLFDKLAVRQITRQILYGPDRIGTLQHISGTVYAILFAVIWGFLFWKCPYGYGNIDETLYLSVPYRVLKWGDGYLIHEWHEFQMSTFPMLPISMLYNLFFPGTERIILNYRLIYTFFWGCSALFFYHRCKSFSKVGAAAASLAYMIYAPYGIMALSYNSMGIMFLLNSFILGLTAQKHKKLQYLFSGLFFAGAVLCCPYLLALYLLFSLAVFFAVLRKKAPQIKTIWFYSTIGAVILFIIFSAFLLSRASIQDLIRSVPIVLHDVEHADRSIISKTTVYLASIWKSSPLSPFILPCFILLCLVSRWRKQTIPWCVTFLCAMIIITLLFYTHNRNHINYLMLPICLIGLYCTLNSDNPYIHDIFRWIWVPGFLYTYCLNYSSNQGLYAITNAAAVPAFASILIVIIFIRSMNQHPARMKNMAILSVMILLTTQICCEISLRYHNVFWENGIKEQKHAADSGPEKDILMTEVHRKTYTNLLQELDPVRKDKQIRSILFLTTDPMLYLLTEKEVGAFSTWLPGSLDFSLDRLDLFYELHPEKIPDAVYIPYTANAYIAHFEEMGYQTSMTSDNNYLLHKEE